MPNIEKKLTSNFQKSKTKNHPQTHAVDPDFLLLPGDALFFAGDVRVAPSLAADKGLSLVPVTSDAAAAGAKTSALLPTPLEASKAFGGGNGSDAAPQPPLALLEEGGNAPFLPSNSKLIQAVVRFKVRRRYVFCGLNFGPCLLSLSSFPDSEFLCFPVCVLSRSLSCFDNGFKTQFDYQNSKFN